MADISQALANILHSSEQLTTWALAVGAGSIAVVVSTSYRRPKSRLWRSLYLFYIVAWAYLAVSLYNGDQLARSYLATGFVGEATVQTIGGKMNNFYEAQREYLSYALAYLGVWLMWYLIGWVFISDFHKGENQ